jgi:hypothetical protein
MLKEPFLEFVKSNAPTEGNFCMALPSNFSEVDGALASKHSARLNEKSLAHHILENVVRPLVNSSSSVRLYGTKFSASSFGGVGGKLTAILKKVRSHYELVLGSDVVTSYEKFWAGYDIREGARRGYVLFVIADPAADLTKIYSFCWDPGVMSASNLRTRFGRTIIGAIDGIREADPECTLLLMESMVDSSMLTIFPGSAVFAQRLDEAIYSNRELR